MNEVSKDLEYNQKEIYQGISEDLAEEENASAIYNPGNLTIETPELTETIKRDLKKPTIPEQLQ